ncbi:hypothetical protein SAMN05216381_1295 [Pseudomonas seleniipraecipitans]|uniref:Uncharacterized protein n=1 Tax=Phytopseudomonas seleniipraecipitans TaxID=640205 RepID=A0A1G7JY52_9GAMM|nr:hypothetical protein SAMN05216381_1295 [Pseudomonas seleniipraecipitans]
MFAAGYRPLALKNGSAAPMNSESALTPCFACRIDMRFLLPNAPS